MINASHTQCQSLKINYFLQTIPTVLCKTCRFPPPLARSAYSETLLILIDWLIPHFLPWIFGNLCYPISFPSSPSIFLLLQSILNCCKLQLYPDLWTNKGQTTNQGLQNLRKVKKTKTKNLNTRPTQIIVNSALWFSDGFFHIHLLFSSLVQNGY